MSFDGTWLELSNRTRHGCCPALGVAMCTRTRASSTSGYIYIERDAIFISNETNAI